MGWWGTLVAVQYLATVVSSAFNASYFWSYRTSQHRRRIGALTMTLISLATLSESLYFGWLILFYEPLWLADFLLGARYWLAARFLVCLGSLLVSGLIIRRWLAR